MQIRSNVVDIANRSIFPAVIVIADGKIGSIEPCPESEVPSTYVLPGFVDAHIHIESSMLTPSQFAIAAMPHGTVATVSDPHEIANVLGLPGVQFMLADGRRVPLKFHFGAPSCVPATIFETAGATITPEETATLLDDPSIGYLAEMMNFPGVLANDPDVIAKIDAAKSRGKRIDGHAPGMRGDDVIRYTAAGITSDHECAEIDEAIEKLDAGMMIWIREGSAARNFDALYRLIDRYPGRIAFCSDDKHPDELEIGHINGLCRRAIEMGCDLFHVLRAACVTPVEHYGLPVGLLRVGDSADLVEVDSLEAFNVHRTWIDGEVVAENGSSPIQLDAPTPINRFDCKAKTPADFAMPGEPGQMMRAIVAHDRLLTTSGDDVRPPVRDGFVQTDPE
ncbi:MAG: amidohydrolase family protein, partial [Planctomycetota bacterium]